MQAHAGQRWEEGWGGMQPAAARPAGFGQRHSPVHVSPTGKLRCPTYLHQSGRSVPAPVCPPGGAPLERGRPWQALGQGLVSLRPLRVLGSSQPIAAAASASGTDVSSGEFVLVPQCLGLTSREGK